MRYPIESLTIGAFRGLRDVALEGLGRVNLLVGPNNTGKTSVLEALAIHCRPRSVRTWLSVAGNREGREWTPPENIEWLFPRKLPSPSLDAIEINSSGVFSSATSVAYQEVSKIERRDLVNDDGETIDTYDEEVRGANLAVTVGVAGEKRERFELSLWWDQIRHDPPKNGPIGEAIETTMITPVSHRIERLQLKRLTEGTLEGVKREALGLLNEIDPTIAGVDILTPDGTRSAILVERQDGVRLPLSAFGDGLRRALLMAFTVPTVPGGLLLVDELESSLHVSALGTMFRWLVGACKKFNVQLFTTHSLDAIDAMLDVEGLDHEAIVAVRLERYQGRVVAEKFEDDMLRRLRFKRGLDVRV